MSMSPELLTALTNSLPSMQLDILKKELQKASEYDGLLEKHQRLSSENVTLRLKNDEFLAKEKETARVHQEALQLQSDLKFKLLEEQVKCQMEITRNVKDLAMAAFRNPTVYKNYQVATPNSNNPGYPTISHLNASETKD